MNSPQPPLELQWVFGVSSDTRGGVVDLRTPTNQIVAYAAGHTVVIYDRSQHQQIFLQGHIHQIQCLVVCPEKKFIVTADCGPDAMLIVWRREDGQVHSAIPQKETEGVVAVDFLKGGDSFATLSAAGRDRTQTLCVWSIGSSGCTLAASLQAFFTDPQHCLQINKDDQDEFVTNGKESVFFWKCFKDKEVSKEHVGAYLKREQAMAKMGELQKSICDLTLSIFVPNTDAAISGMVSGEVIFWQEPRSPFFNEPSKGFSLITSNDKSRKKDATARRMHAIKIVRLHHSAITHLCVQSNYIVTGGSDGYVRFYDPKLGLVGWFEELQAGEITSISFSAIDNDSREGTGWTLQVPPFIVGTKKGHVLFLDASVFEEQPGSVQHKGEEMMDFVPKAVKCASAHPQLPEFATINADGLFQVHDYNIRRICAQREFPKLKAETIAYSSSGLVIACGFLNGFLKIIESETLLDMDNIAVSRSGITKLEFSTDETLLGVADASFAVSLINCSISEDHLEDKWEYVGKFRSHARTIAGLHFTRGTNGDNRLFSVGHDCMLVEYDLVESVKEKRLKLRGTWPVNATSLPLALISTTSFKKGENYKLVAS